MALLVKTKIGESWVMETVIAWNMLVFDRRIKVKETYE